ncbi:dynein axonemal intermediate chain 7 isoform X5 [Balaenoptera acutorostrata]|uniref:Dynein axonemal intermediate chain 7 n=1 Tax=Balaenoptera acutorostrata TaxID=9767 RepID=A0ABM3UDS0_BALAC|nr:dynein axonemal intermediate chain 7 isoform X5 [Balaenoptera acutorostrata]
MGPKAKKSGSKKKRITKADRLKQLQEEEEKRQKEEEEARVKYEKEEMERLEIQRTEKEKLRKLEAKDLERRNEELEELYLLEACFPEAEKLKRDSRLLSQWKHYIQCDGSPDPSISQEINTFISLWKEETNETFEAVTAKSKLVLNLIEKLKLILLETPSYDLQEKNIIQYQGSILELQELLHLKFNIATEILLRQASTLADLDSGNMEKVIRDENVTLYVWANLKKNPRYRSIRFSETQIGFEIPRILATSDIALRLLHTHYDHVTPLGPVPTAPQEHTSTVTYFGKDEVKSVEAAVSKDLQEEYNEQENESNVVHEEETKVDEQGGIEGQTSLGPVNVSPTGHQRQILKEGLQKYTYPPETAEDFETENAFPPIEVMLEVHENVIFFENPVVARWDAEGKHWKTDGISNVSYKSEDRLITFSLETLGPVTLIQDAHVNMPYQSWELRPLDVNKVLLTVTTVFTEIQIQIKENLCMLASIKLNDKKHSSILEEKWMTPVSFIIALKEAGLNIFPTGHSHFYVVINYKLPLVEVKAYRQMALLSSAFAFGWSKWNTVCDSKKVLFQVREHLPKEEPIQNPNWTLLMFSGDRAQSLKINESSDAFSEALKEETEFHSTLYHMVKDFASKEAMKKVRCSNCQFVDSVCHMLLSTRLLSYS